MVKGITISAFPSGKRDFQKCSNFDSDDTSFREIPKSEANLPSDGKVVFLKTCKLDRGSDKAANLYGTSM